MLRGNNQGRKTPPGNQEEDNKESTDCPKPIKALRLRMARAALTQTEEAEKIQVAPVLVQSDVEMESPMTYRSEPTILDQTIHTQRSDKDANDFVKTPPASTVTVVRTGRKRKRMLEIPPEEDFSSVAESIETRKCKRLRVAIDVIDETRRFILFTGTLWFQRHVIEKLLASAETPTKLHEPRSCEREALRVTAKVEENWIETNDDP